MLVFTNMEQVIFSRKTTLPLIFKNTAKNPPISVNVCLLSLLVFDDMLYILYSMNLCSKLGNRIT